MVFLSLYWTFVVYLPRLKGRLSLHYHSIAQCKLLFAHDAVEK